MSILKVLFVILEVVVLFNLLIAVHELGHFLAARWRGLKIQRFAIWFGKPIWKTTVNGVEYALGWIPAGGYVSLPQMASMEAVEGKSVDSPEPLPPVSALDKIIVAFAGPLFSFLLALGFAVIVWQVGKPAPVGDDKPMLGWVVPDGPAWKAGLRAGDLLLEIDGHPIKTYGPPSSDSVIWRVITSEGTNIAIKYLRAGKEQMAYATPFKRETKWYERRAMRQILVTSVFKPVVGSVVANSPADKTGLHVGDEIVAVNGEKILSISAVEYAEDQMTNKDARPVTLTIKRGTEEIDKSLMAEQPSAPAGGPPIFGIAWKDNTNRVLLHPRPWEQIEAAAGQIFATIGTVISRKSDVGAQHLGGAVMIIRVYTSLFQDVEGWRLVLWFSVVLNVNLAMLNMLPLPVLDGGHILLSLVEVVRRRAANPKLLNYIQTAFAVVLITFMAWIGALDISEWIRSARSDRQQQIIFAPKSEPKN